MFPAAPCTHLYYPLVKQTQFKTNKFFAESGPQGTPAVERKKRLDAANRRLNALIGAEERSNVLPDTVERRNSSALVAAKGAGVSDQDSSVQEDLEDFPSVQEDLEDFPSVQDFPVQEVPVQEVPVQEVPDSDRDQGVPTCRICRQNGDEDPLVKPCKCTGTIAFVHEKCLRVWQDTQLICGGAATEAAARCGICGAEYAAAFAPRSISESYLRRAVRFAQENAWGMGNAALGAAQTMGFRTNEQIKREYYFNKRLEADNAKVKKQEKIRILEILLHERQVDFRDYDEMKGFVEALVKRHDIKFLQKLEKIRDILEALQPFIKDYKNKIAKINRKKLESAKKERQEEEQRRFLNAENERLARAAHAQWDKWAAEEAEGKRHRTKTMATATDPKLYANRTKAMATATDPKLYANRTTTTYHDQRPSGMMSFMAGLFGSHEPATKQAVRKRAPPGHHSVDVDGLAANFHRGDPFYHHGKQNKPPPRDWNADLPRRVLRPRKLQLVGKKHLNARFIKVKV